MIEPLNPSPLAKRGKTGSNVFEGLIGDHPLRPRLQFDQAHAFELAIGRVVVDARQMREHDRFGRFIRHQDLDRRVDCECDGGFARFGVAIGQCRGRGASDQQKCGERSKFHSGHTHVGYRLKRINAANCLSDEAGSGVR